MLSTLNISHPFELLFKIQRNEFYRVQLFFLFLTSIGMFYTISATVGDTLFLARFGAEKAEQLLPWVYVGIAFATIIASSIYNVLQTRINQVVLIISTQILLAISVFSLKFLITFDIYWLYYVLIIWLEVCALLSITIFFSFISNYFTSRDARRVYGYITGGLAFGTVISGYLIDIIVNLTSTTNLLYVCGGLLLLGAFITFKISQDIEPIPQKTTKTTQSAQVPLSELSQSPYLRWLFVMVLAAMITIVLVDFQLKVMASRSLGEVELATFFGQFYAYIGLAQLIIQFFLVRWLLKHLGILRSLMILPLTMVISGLGFLMFPTLMIAAIANFVRMSLSETLDLPSRELLFLPLPKRIRLSAQVFVGGALVPGGQGLGGIILLCLALFITDISFYSAFVVGFAVLWGITIAYLRPYYQVILSDSLSTQNKRISINNLGDTLATCPDKKVYRQLLLSPRHHLASLTLKLLRFQPLSDIESLIPELLQSNHKAVIINALSWLRSNHNTTLVQDHADLHFTNVRKLLHHSDQEIQAQAILTLCSISWQNALDYIKAESFFETASYESRIAAQVGVVRYAGIEGAFLTFPYLQALLKSNSPEKHIEAIKVIREVDLCGRGRIMQRFLNDANPEVRYEAIITCKKIRDPMLIQSLLNCLVNSKLKIPITDALQAMPPEAIPLLMERLQDSNLTQLQRMVLTDVLSSIGGKEVRILFEQMMAASHENIILRLSIGQALRRLLEREGIEDAISEHYVEHVQHVCNELELMHSASQQIMTENKLINNFFFDQAQLYIKILLSLLSLQHGVKMMSNIEHNLFSSNQALKSNALELLEISLPHELPNQQFLMLMLQDFTLQSGPEAPTHDNKPGLSALTLARLLNNDPWIKPITQYYLKFNQ